MITSCDQYDSSSKIEDQRRDCFGKVYLILYVVHEQHGKTKVCEAHMPSWNERHLREQGFKLDQPREIGVIQTGSEAPSVNRESGN